MATIPRFFENGSYYHIYNRGNRKQQIFLNNKDYERFLEKVIEYKTRHPVAILAYCLMPNHFHFLLQQLTSNAISNFISNLCNSQSRYFNVKYESIGSLYQGRFKAKKVDKDEYLIHLSRYIHLNPTDLLNSSQKYVLEELFRYRWSSLPLYLSESANAIINPSLILNYFSSKNPIKDYKNFVVSNLNMKVDPIIEHLIFES